MLNKNECRSYINSKRKYLNLSAICKECNVQPPHLSYFLKGDAYNHYLPLDKLNSLVDFIRNI